MDSKLQSFIESRPATKFLRTFNSYSIYSTVDPSLEDGLKVISSRRIQDTGRTFSALLENTSLTLKSLVGKESLMEEGKLEFSVSR